MAGESTGTNGPQRCPEKDLSEPGLSGPPVAGLSRKRTIFRQVLAQIGHTLGVSPGRPSALISPSVWGFKGEEWSGRPDLNWRRPPWEDCGDRPPRQYCRSCSHNTLFAAARFHKSRDVGTNMAQSEGKPVRELPVIGKRK